MVDEADEEQWFAPGTQDRSEAGWGVGILERHGLKQVL